MAFRAEALAKRGGVRVRGTSTVDARARAALRRGGARRAVVRVTGREGQESGQGQGEKELHGGRGEGDEVGGG